METYKARLVAKEYRQCDGINYDDTFSPMVMLKSIQIMLAIAAYLVDGCEDSFPKWRANRRDVYDTT